MKFDLKKIDQLTVLSQSLSVSVRTLNRWNKKQSVPEIAKSALMAAIDDKIKELQEMRQKFE